MPATRHRRHPTELKIGLAEACLDGERSLKALAKSGDISHSLLVIRVEKYRRRELTAEVDFVAKRRSREAHVAALERKIGQLTMEIDALEKRQRATSPGAGSVSITCGPSASESPADAASRASPGAPTKSGPIRKPPLSGIRHRPQCGLPSKTWSPTGRSADTDESRAVRPSREPQQAARSSAEAARRSPCQWGLTKTFGLFDRSHYVRHKISR